MAIDKLLLSPGIRERLGENGVDEVAVWLWPEDCQSCGEPLGQRPSALCIDDLQDFAWATLHHERCRALVWNDSAT